MGKFFKPGTTPTKNPSYTSAKEFHWVPLKDQIKQLIQIAKSPEEINILAKAYEELSVLDSHTVTFDIHETTLNVDGSISDLIKNTLGNIERTDKYV